MGRGDSVANEVTAGTAPYNCAKFLQLDHLGRFSFFLFEKLLYSVKYYGEICSYGGV